LCAYLASKYGAWGGVLSIIVIETLSFICLILILKRKKLLFEVLSRNKNG
ncbi:flippase, partial [Yersinia enterocolitica]|nr:flippase [Yersinia enterocolitica]